MQAHGDIRLEHVVDPPTPRPDVGAGKEHVARPGHGKLALGVRRAAGSFARMLHALFRQLAARGVHQVRRTQRRGRLVTLPHQLRRRAERPQPVGEHLGHAQRHLALLDRRSVADAEPAFLQLRPASAEVPGIERHAQPCQRFVGGGRIRRRQRGAGSPIDRRQRFLFRLGRGETQGVQIVQWHARFADHGGVRVDADERLPAAVRGIERFQPPGKFLAGDRPLPGIEPPVIGQFRQGTEVLGPGRTDKQEQGGENGQNAKKSHEQINPGQTRPEHVRGSRKWEGGRVVS